MSAKSKASQPEGSTPRRTFLYVDTSREDIEIFRTGFARADLADYLAIACNTAEAMDAFAAGAPEVVVISLATLEKNGFDVVSFIRMSSPCVPIVVLASSIHSEDLALLYSLGIVAVYEKPADQDDYLTLVSGLAQLSHLRLPPPRESNPTSDPPPSSDPHASGPRRTRPIHQKQRPSRGSGHVAQDI